MKFLILMIFACTAVHMASGRVLSKCEIARELQRQGFPKNLLPSWVCLVLAESSGNTAAVGRVNPNGSRDYGPFQANNRIWCKNGSVGGDCRVTCESLLSDDITTACNCAKIIYNRRGFSAWAGWKSKCQGTLPNLSDCRL